MIRNLIILDSEGNSLLAANFGECHSLGTRSDLIGSFVSAIYSFGQTIIGQEIRNIRFENLDFLVLTKADIIFMISTDDGASRENRRKLDRISSLFAEQYEKEIIELKTTGASQRYDGFVDFLHHSGITQPNCGGRPTCADCPDHRVLPLEEMTKTVRNESSPT